MAFSRGLLDGFQFVEGIANQRRQARLDEERLGLARAANTRAEAAFQSQQQQLRDARQRQEQTDRANQLLAQASRVGIDNLDPEQLAELEEAAAFNPNITAVLEEHRLGQQDIAAIRDISSLAQRPRSLSDVAATATQAAAPQAQPQVQGDFVTPEMAVIMGGEPGVPELPAGPSAEVPPTLVGSPGAQPAMRSVGVGLLRGAGIEVPESAIRRVGGRSEVMVPAEAVRQLQSMGDLGVVEREQVRNNLRRQLGDPSGEMTRAKLEAEAANDSLERWRGFLDMDSGTGTTLRTEAAQDPLAVATQFREDFNTLKRLDPNTFAAVAREMTPVVDQATRLASEQMRSVPVNDQGLVDTSTPEFRRAHRALNDMLSLQQNMSDDFNDQIEAQIRGHSMPVGNAELASNVASTVANTAEPGQPPTDNSIRANTTMARRAVAGVANGGRNLSTRQVESLAWLAKRGYITPSGFEQFLATGSFTDPKDVEFFDHDPNKILYRQDPDGTVEIAYVPPKLTGAEREWPKEQLAMINDVFAPPPGASDAHVQWLQRQKYGFMVAMRENPAALALAGLDAQHFGDLEPQDIALLAVRYQALSQVQSAYENHWFWGLSPVQWFTGGFEDENVNPFDRTLNDIGRRFGVDVPSMPVSKPQVDAARMQLLTSDDPVQRILGYTGSDADIARAINEEVAAAAEQQ